MAFLRSALFIVILAAKVFCDDNTPILDLPAEIIQELIDILNGILHLQEQCGPPTVNTSDVRFLLYNRSDPNNPINLDPTNPVQIDPTKKIVLVSHGWMSGSNMSHLPKLKNAFLQRYDCNLVMVDWSPIAAQQYTEAYCDLPAVGGIVGQFLCLLANTFSVALSTVHLVGHSLGAHMSGFASQYTQATCGQILGRISGLDPAGPLFQDLPIANRLDASDATFVDIYHSNEKVLGYDGPCGKIDFYLNGGTLQPRCVSVTPNNLTQSTIGDVGCSHSFSMLMYAESVNAAPPNVFVGKSCTYILECLVDIIQPKYILAGEDCPMNYSIKHNFYLPTRDTSPYAAGCTPYLSGCSV